MGSPGLRVSGLYPSSGQGRGGAGMAGAAAQAGVMACSLILRRRNPGLVLLLAALFAPGLPPTVASAAQAVSAGPDATWLARRSAAFRARPAPARATPGHAPRPGTVLWDGPAYPAMIVVPAGRFSMGSPADEPGRRADEGPVHRVDIARPFAVGRMPVSVGEFARFVAETGYDAGATCKTFEGGSWDDHRAGRNWRNPGFAQTADDPVVCMNYADALAYAAWLSRRTGHAYRLLSEAEYEYAARAGSTTPWWWGDAIGANRASCTSCGNPRSPTGTVPSGRFPPNAFGLYDMAGNAWSWVADCWNADYAGAPADGSPRTDGDCTRRAQRGGAWFYAPGALRSAIRVGDEADLRNYHNGFRLARDL